MLLIPDSSTREALHRLSEERGLPVAEIASEILRGYLSENQLGTEEPDKL